jgi:hypothetical protein
MTKETGVKIFKFVVIACAIFGAAYLVDWKIFLAMILLDFAHNVEKH